MGKATTVKHVLVHGPKACGKTRNKDRLAAAFGCEAIVDGAHWTEIKKLARSSVTKTLFLTHEVPSKALAAMVGVVPFETAMRLSEPKSEE